MTVDVLCSKTVTPRLERHLCTLRQHTRRRPGHVFTAAEAAAWGVPSWDLSRLAASAETSGLVRRDRGVYEIYPFTRLGHYYAAWRRAGTDAIYSHVTALELYELSDLQSRGYEFTVSRERRSRTPGEFGRLHFVTEMPARRWYNDVPLTTPARTIVDCALYGDQTEMAVAQAIGRCMTTEEELLAEAAARSRAVRDAIEYAIKTCDYYKGYV